MGASSSTDRASSGDATPPSASAIIARRSLLRRFSDSNGHPDRIRPSRLLRRFTQSKLSANSNDATPPTERPDPLHDTIASTSCTDAATSQEDALEPLVDLIPIEHEPIDSPEQPEAIEMPAGLLQPEQEEVMYAFTLIILIKAKLSFDSDFSRTRRMTPEEIAQAQQDYIDSGIDEQEEEEEQPLAEPPVATQPTARPSTMSTANVAASLPTRRILVQGTVSTMMTRATTPDPLRPLSSVSVDSSQSQATDSDTTSETKSRSNYG